MLEQVASIIFNQIGKNAETNITVSKIASIQTGKEDANFSSAQGFFPFFTCSQEILKCNITAFCGNAVLIAGNGDFNVKHFSGEFNAYQRTYILIPHDEIYYGTLFMACQKTIANIKRQSSGSIIKFITKSDIENIPIPILKNEYYHRALNNCILKIDAIRKQKEHLYRHKEFLIPILMNGQVVVR